MANSELYRMFQDQQRAAEGAFEAEFCIVAVGAEAEDDEVFVTLPNSESPQDRIHVAFWRLQFGLDGDAVVARYPTRGDRGVALYVDTGEICLIY